MFYKVERSFISTGECQNICIVEKVQADPRPTYTAVHFVSVIITLTEEYL
jgi:hypothetical protein